MRTLPVARAIVALACFLFSADALAAPYVYRGLTLPRGDWALDAGLGIGHIDGGNDEWTGLGVNLEVAVGIASMLQLGVRTGLRLGHDGRFTRADEYGRMFETETYGTGGESVANPEIALRWSVAQGSSAELALEGRAYIPIEERTHFGVMFGLPIALRLGSSARIDTGVFVPLIFDEDRDGDGDSDGASHLVSIPLHLWFQVDSRTFLGPLLGVRFVRGDERFPLGFGLGYALSYEVDLETWLLFPDISCSGCGKNFGAGVGIQARF